MEKEIAQSTWADVVRIANGSIGGMALKFMAPTTVQEQNVVQILPNDVIEGVQKLEVSFSRVCS